MDQQVRKHICIIGGKGSIEKCLKTITGKTHYICKMVTDIEDVRLGTDDVLLENLKEHHMECESSLDLSGVTYPSKHSIESTSDLSPKMKRLKSIDKTSEYIYSRNYAHSDVGYESDTTESEENKETRASICAIIVEDDTAWIKNLASFVFTTIEWPALILLPIDSEIFNIDLYVDFITELGMYASGNKEESKLMIVVISSERAEVQTKLLKHRRRLACIILDSYFGKKLDFCETENFVRKVKEFLDSQSGKLESDINMINSHKLVNRFHSTLNAIREISPCSCTVNIENFLEAFNNIPESRSFMDDMLNLRLIHERGNNEDKCVTLMPLICSEIIPKFEKVDYKFDTNPLKMEFNLDIMSPFLRAKISKTILDKDWSVKSSGPESCKKDSILFSKESHRILIHFKVSKQKASTMFLYGLSTPECTDCLASKEYEELRENIERELNVCRGGSPNENNAVKYYVKLKDDKYFDSVNTEVEELWLEVDLRNIDQKIASSITGYLSPWFSSEISEVEKELNKRMSDSVLTDISNLIGMGYFLFFLSQGIPRATLERIDLENQKSIKGAISKMLEEWRKMKGSGANLAVLRSALENSSHVMVNIHDFDEVVKRHNGKQ